MRLSRSLYEIPYSQLTVIVSRLDTVSPSAGSNAKRKALVIRYIQNIHNPKLRLPSLEYCENSVHHIFPILCESRDELQQYLTTNGVQTLIHYPIPPHKQRCYTSLSSLSMPITEQIHAQELSIPLNQVLEESEIATIITLLNEF